MLSQLNTTGHEILAVTLGELEISPVMTGFLIGIAIFMFAAVGISSIKLFDFEDETED